MPAHIAIDLGDKYLFAVVCDREGVRPLLLKNPLRADLLETVINNLSGSRCSDEAQRLSEYAGSVAEFLLEKCKEWNVKHIAVGNRGVSSPYATKFVAPFKPGVFVLNFSLLLMETLRFRCALNGIVVNAVDENRTSVEYGFESLRSSGSKKGGKLGRNQFVSSESNGRVAIHRDVNGAINIGKRTFGDEFSAKVKQSKLWNRPEEVLIPYTHHRMVLFTESGVVREKLFVTKELVAFIDAYLSLNAMWKILDFVEAKYSGKKTMKARERRTAFAGKFIPVNFAAYDSIWQPVFEKKVLKPQEMLRTISGEHGREKLELLWDMEKELAEKVSTLVPGGLMPKGMYCVPGYGTLSVNNYESYISLPAW